MALTSAERAKRYRENLKKNPEKYEIQRKKQLQRLKANTKKISELSETEKIEKRRIWREQKKKQKQNKKLQETEKHVKPKTKLKPKSHAFKIKYNKVIANYKKSLKNMEKMKSTIETLRKRLYRLKKKYETEVNLLEEKNNKLEVRQEILEISLRQRYQECKTNREKQNFRELGAQAAIGTKGSKYISKCLGLKGRIRFSKKRKYLNKTIKEEMRLFYERDDISRCTAGKKECRTEKKQKRQIRYLTDTLMNLYSIYKKEGGKYGFTTFHKYKPFYVLSPNANARETCLCIKHSNFQYLFDALKKNAILAPKPLQDFMCLVNCDVNSYLCMYGKCDNCKNLKVEFKANPNSDNTENITWYQWERANKTYKKSGEEFVTKITKKQLKTGSLAALISEFKAQIPIFKKHYYNCKEQQRQYRQCINNLKDHEIALICDFSENYNCKLSEEIQSMHFGGSKNSITLHTGMIFGHQSQSFVTVCDDNSHDPSAIWAHLIPVIKFAKQLNRNLKVIHFFSDGPSSQYRQKKNFYLLNLFTTKLNLSYTTWSFSESGHGKGVADGIGGAVKRALDRRVSYGHDIIDASDAFNNLEICMKSVKCFYIPESDIENIKSLIPNDLKVVPKTMQIHQIISKTGESNIQHRPLSCFCGTEQDLCTCLSPEIHSFYDMCKSDIDITERIPTADDLVYEFDLNSCVFDQLMTIGNIVTENISESGNISLPTNKNESTLPIFESCKDTSLIDCDAKVMPNSSDLKSHYSTAFELTEKNSGTQSLEQDIIASIVIENKSESDNISFPTNKNKSTLPIFESCNDTSLIDSDAKVMPNSSDLTPHYQTALELTIKNSGSQSSEQDGIASTSQIMNKHFLTLPNQPITNPRKRIILGEHTNMPLNKKVKKPVVLSHKTTRVFFCRQCKKNYRFDLSKMVACLICKSWICTSCSGPVQIDSYVCTSCSSINTYFCC